MALTDAPEMDLNEVSWEEGENRKELEGEGKRSEGVGEDLRSQKEWPRVSSSNASASAKITCASLEQQKRL